MGELTEQQRDTLKQGDFPRMDVGRPTSDPEKARGASAWPRSSPTRHRGGASDR